MRTFGYGLFSKIMVFPIDHRMGCGFFGCSVYLHACISQRSCCSCGRAAPACNDSTKATEVERVVQSSIDSRSTIFTDKSTSYADLADMVEAHIWEAPKDAVESESLRWVHTGISNAKRTLLGIYHRINME
jgi:hypothetical protein